MNQRKLTYVAIVLGLILLAMTSFIIFYMIKNGHELSDRIDAKLSTIQNGKDAEPPSKEYLTSLITPLIPEPINGRDGQDSLSTHTVETKTVVQKIIEQVPVNGKDGRDGKDGVDGRLLEIRCNDVKNRWEIRYVGDGSWSGIKDTSDNLVKCVIPNIGE